MRLVLCSFGRFILKMYFVFMVDVGCGKNTMTLQIQNRLSWFVCYSVGWLIH